MSRPVLVLHVPVLHAGYLEFFRRVAPEVERVWIMGDELVKELRFFEADISAVSAADARSLIVSLGLFPSVEVLGASNVTALGGMAVLLVADELSRRFAERYLAGEAVRWESVFLRWDEAHVASARPVNFERRSDEPFDRAMIAVAYAEARKSGDWWRQVGAILVKDGGIIARAYNRAMPDEQSNYRLGDIRDYLKPGEKPELSNAIHAENRIIAEAARVGLCTAGTHLYVTHFPCPVCAKAVAASGMAKVFFGQGSASFDAEMVLRAAGIELVCVPGENSHG